MKKCSKIGQQEINENVFCYECKIYMWNKWEKSHSDLFQNLHTNKIIKEINTEDIFIGICNEENHVKELLYFCKYHNQLCCVNA